MTFKLFKVTLRGGINPGSTNYNASFVVAESPDAETGNRDHVVGPDQMVPNGKCWQITEERKAAIDRGLQFLEWSYAKNSALDTKEQIAVLRAMLDEDTHGKP